MCWPLANIANTCISAILYLLFTPVQHKHVLNTAKSQPLTPTRFLHDGIVRGVTIAHQWHSPGGRGGRAMAFPNDLRKRTCEKFKSGQILRGRAVRELNKLKSIDGSLHSYLQYVFFRFKKHGKLVSKYGRTCLRALEIQNSSEVACARTPLNGL